MDNNIKQNLTDNNTQNEPVNQKISNPIDNSKIMPLNTRTSANRLYGGWANSINKSSIIDYNQILSVFNSLAIKEKDYLSFFRSIFNNFYQTLNLNFLALGILNKNANYINIKLTQKSGASYSSKIFLNEEQNYIIKSYKTKQAIISTNCDFLKIGYIQSTPSTIIPLINADNCLGVMIFPNDNSDFLELYKLFSNYYAIFYNNQILSELVDKNTDKDALTGLYNYKKFQEELNSEIQKTAPDSSLALCIIDIANISMINNELGHAKGDSVIKEVAQKLKKNKRNTDILGRYAGDKIGVIMPNTNEDSAKYLCEFLLYALSCTMFDTLGQLQFSCGISIYPNSASKQEKLTILAEQALYIAKSKRNDSGVSKIISPSDYNFWDDEALKCFAQVIGKKHSSIALNIEEELIKQFHSETILSNEHLLDVVSSLVNTIDAKDTYTKGHSAAVSRYSEALARAINLPSSEVERIKLGALLHDIGKIGIPEQVLRKPTMLNDEEWEIMKQHPLIGADKVLKPNKALNDLIPIVKYHHEHIDGSGYPYGLKGDEIPLSARIVAIADAYHALISDRPYRKGLSVNKACEILKMGANVQWDKELVRKFIIIAPSLATNI